MLSIPRIFRQRGVTLRCAKCKLRAALFIASLILLGWLCWYASPVGAQEPSDISVEGSGGLAVPGDEVTYHLRLLNWTEDIVPGGIISHTLPAGFSYVPGSTQVTVGGWPVTQVDPLIRGETLAWGPFQLPAAGHTAHNPYGVHTFVQDLCLPEFIDFQLDQALELVGSGGYVTQLFYRITPDTNGPDPCATYFVNAAYDRNLVPILRLQGVWNPAGFWEKPDPGPNGDYAEIADAFARYVAGLPRRSTHPLYITVWNEPDLWIEWSGKPNAQEYGRFFVAVSNAIRHLDDSGIRILNGALTPSNTTFIRQLMQVPGFVTAFDAWASHCYPYNHPPWYNIHRGTARYGNAVIDCYIQERDTIARYGGRTGFKFVIKETGHGLGDNLYSFEGFPRINQANRADYISSAFKDYWRKWPEIIAVTPFELGDPWNGWEWLDWMDYTVSLAPFEFSYTPHRQYHAVTDLDKPRGAPVPHGVEVMFRARVADDLPTGTYVSHLAGSAFGATDVLTQAAPVQVVAHVERMYLPVVGAARKTGVWYMQVLPDPSSPNVPQGPLDWEVPQGSEGDGAIIPTRFISGTVHLHEAPSQTIWREMQAADGEELRVLTLDTRAERAYFGLTGGGLKVLNLRDLEIEKHISLDADPIALALGPKAGTLYAALNTGEVILIDVVDGAVIARASGLGLPRSLVFDAQTRSLLVADAEQEAIVRLEGDLSARLAMYPLGAAPDQVLLESADRRLYIMLPGAGRILALDTDTLRPVAEAGLAGGPLIEMALDPARDQLYVLSALSPRYRGISVLRAEDLSLLALVAGSLDTPLKQAMALALSSDGHLLVAEGTHLYRISPDSFTLVNQARQMPEYAVGRGGLAADPITNRTIWVAPTGVYVEEAAVAP